MNALEGKQFRQIFEAMKDMPRIDAIDRIDWPSREMFLNEIAPAGKPVVLAVPEGSVPPKEKLMEVLRSQFGSITIKARTDGYDRPERYVSNRKHREMSLVEYLDAMEAGTCDTDYLGNHSLPDGCLECFSINIPLFYPAYSYEVPRLWLGPKGAVTPLHKDSADNFALSCWGKKLWILFPVSDVPNLYMDMPLPVEYEDFAVSAVDVRSPDLLRFPLYGNAKPVSVVVGEGEMLYLPTGWGHYVENLESTMMVNRWVNRKIQPPAVLGASA